MQPQYAVPQDLTEAELDEAWQAISAENPAAADRATSLLASGRNSTVAFLRRELSPATAADLSRVKQWIDELAHDDFRRRDEATRELRRLGQEIEPELRAALKSGPSPEAAARIDRLLSEFQPNAEAARERPDREIMAVELLARIGSPNAIELLSELAAGPANESHTEAARAALREFARED
jgi:hypothetical protein